MTKSQKKAEVYDFFPKGVNKIVPTTLNCDAQVIIHQGGTSCFSGDTKVCTSEGLKEIRHIIPGDTVLSHNEKTGQDEWKVVTDHMCFGNTKQTVRVKLKNGESITVTSDHLFYYKNKWTPIIEILQQLKNGG